MALPPYLHVITSEAPGSSNCFLIRGGRTCLVDSGASAAGDTIVAAIRAATGGADRPDIVVNTHVHPDHVGNNTRFAEAGSLIHVHADGATRAAHGERRHWYRRYFPGHTAFPVHRFLADGDEIDLGSVRLRVVATPGHTADSLCLHEPAARLLFSGDTVLRDDCGVVNARTDWRESVSLMEGHLEKLAALDLALIAPGHGPLVTDVAATLRGALGRLAAMRARPEKMVRHGVRHCLLPVFFRLDRVRRDEITEMFRGSDWYRSLEQACPVDVLARQVDAAIDGLLLYGVLEERGPDLVLDRAVFKQVLGAG